MAKKIVFIQGAPRKNGNTRAMTALALLSTAGGPLEDNLDLLERQWKNPAEMLGCSFLSCLFPDTIVEAGELAKDPAAAEKAMYFGWRLAAV